MIKSERDCDKDDESEPKIKEVEVKEKEGTKRAIDPDRSIVYRPPAVCPLALSDYWDRRRTHKFPHHAGEWCIEPGLGYAHEVKLWESIRFDREGRVCWG